MSDFDGSAQLARAADLRDQPFKKRQRGAPRAKGAPLEVVSPSGRPATATLSEDGATVDVRVRGAYRVVLAVRRVEVMRPVTAAELLASEMAFEAAMAAADELREARNALVCRALDGDWTPPRAALAMLISRQRVHQIASKGP